MIGENPLDDALERARELAGVEGPKATGQASGAPRKFGADRRWIWPRPVVC